jgi:hypothetical protein
MPHSISHQMTAIELTVFTPKPAFHLVSYVRLSNHPAPHQWTQNPKTSKDAELGIRGSELSEMSCMSSGEDRISMFWFYSYCTFHFFLKTWNENIYLDSRGCGPLKIGHEVVPYPLHPNVTIFLQTWYVFSAYCSLKFEKNLREVT